MLKKLQKKLRSNLPAVIIVGLAVFGFGAYGAYQAVTPVEVNEGGVVNIYNNGETPEMAFGAASDFCAGDEAVTNMCVVDIYSLILDNNVTLNSDATFTISGTVTFGDNATTTPSKHTYAPIAIDLGLHATSTAEDTTIIAGHYCNTGDSTLIRPDLFDLQVKTAATNFGTGALTWGTTSPNAGDTWLVGTRSFNASSTATLGSLSIASSATGFFNFEGMTGALGDIYNTVDANHATSTKGTYFDGQVANYLHNTTTPYALLNGECVVVGFDVGGATSSDSLLTGGGELFDGTLYLDASID